MTVQPHAPNAPGAVASLVLGILGIVLCPLFAPFGWYLGARAEQAVTASQGSLEGGTMATAGKILGIAGTVVLVLAVLAGIAAAAGLFTID
ncbi:MAG TPA: DUF4190 domain-containing protein [Solirubrobacteraceae bacterium]|nr:DUF4190 domain-containing protein [Solirubrobacteraceae bacterium]